MKTTCYSKKCEDIIIPELDIIIIKKLKKSENSPFINYVWNKRAIDILKRDYPKVQNREMKIIELSRKVGKSYASVRNKVRRMGLTKC
jgi:purine nucleoside permease